MTGRTLHTLVTVAILASVGCAHGVDPIGPDDGKESGGSTGAFPGSDATGGGADLGSGGSGASSGSTSSGGTSPGGGTSSGGKSSGGGGPSGGASPNGGASGGDGGGAVVVDPVLPGDLVVQYMPGNLEPGSVKAQFAIVNRGTKTVPLAQLTLRYWYTADGTPTGSNYQDATVDYAEIQRLTNNGTKAVASTGAVKPPQPGADTYLEIGFMGPNSLGPTQMDVDHKPLVSTQQIQARVNWPGYTVNYTQTNDYSYAMKTAFVDWPKVTLYQAGVLVFGVEPDGTKPSGAVPDAGTTTTPADAGAD